MTCFFEEKDKGVREFIKRGHQGRYVEKSITMTEASVGDIKKYNIIYLCNAGIKWSPVQRCSAVIRIRSDRRDIDGDKS